jgi:DNA-binding MarR family transcriptional regulator
MTSKNIEMLEYILRGKNRIQVYDALSIHFRGLLPREIKSFCKIGSYSTITRNLKGLLLKGVIQCTDSYNTRGKLYYLTEEAQELKEDILDHVESKFPS